MSPQTELAVTRLEGLFGLSSATATRVVAEVLDCFRSAVDDYVRQRHGELREQGLSNDIIFERIAQELPHERFVAPPYTPRQLRRRIYG